MVVGITNALNVVADALGDATPDLAALTTDANGDQAQALFGDIRAFYARNEVPLPCGASLSPRLPVARPMPPDAAPMITWIT